MPLPSCSFLSLLPHPGLRCSLRCKSDERGGEDRVQHVYRIVLSSMCLSLFLPRPLTLFHVARCRHFLFPTFQPPAAAWEDRSGGGRRRRQFNIDRRGEASVPLRLPHFSLKKKGEWRGRPKLSFYCFRSGFSAAIPVSSSPTLLLSLAPLLWVPPQPPLSLPTFVGRGSAVMASSVTEVGREERTKPSSPVYPPPILAFFLTLLRCLPLFFFFLSVLRFFVTPPPLRIISTSEEEGEDGCRANIPPPVSEEKGEGGRDKRGAFILPLCRILQYTRTT